MAIGMSAMFEGCEPRNEQVEPCKQEEAPGQT